MKPPSLLLRPPDEVSIAFAVDRADLFVEGAKKLLDALPWLVSGAARAALLAAQVRMKLGALDVLDPWFWQQRGFDLAGGAGFWIAGDLSLALGAVSWRPDAERFFGELLRGEGKARLDERDEVTVGVQADGSVQGAFGFVDRFAWLSMPVASREQAQQARRLVLAARDGEGGEVASMLNAALGAPHALRMGTHRDEKSDPLGLAVAPGDRELRLGLAVPAKPDDDAKVGFLCRRGADPEATAPPGALAVLNGIDLGEAMREGEPERVREGDDPGGTGVVVLNEVDKSLIPLLVRGASFDDVLGSGALHGSVWGRLSDEAWWRRTLDEAVDRGEASAAGKGDARAYRVPLQSSAPEGPAAWVGFERGALLVSLGEDDLRAARRAARGWGSERLSRSLDDPEARAMLERGEPFVYVRVAELAERLKGLVLALVKEGSWGKGLGARELLQVLSRIEDALGQIRINTGGPTQMRFKLRLR